MTLILVCSFYFTVTPTNAGAQHLICKLCDRLYPKPLDTSIRWYDVNSSLSHNCSVTPADAGAQCLMYVTYVTGLYSKPLDTSIRWYDVNIQFVP